MCWLYSYKIKVCGYSILWVFKICGYSKSIDSKNLWVLKFVGAQNLWVLKIWVLKFVGIQYKWVLIIYCYSKSAGIIFCGTQNLWVMKVCDETNFQVDGGGKSEHTLISAYRVNRKNICALSIYSFCHMRQRGLISNKSNK